MTAPLPPLPDLPLSALPRRLYPEVVIRHPAPPPDSWRPLTGGRSNLCWQLPEPDKGRELGVRILAALPPVAARPEGLSQLPSRSGRGDSPSGAAAPATGPDLPEDIRPPATVEMVLKLYRPGSASALFPNDPQAEAAVLAALSGQALAPDPLAAWTGAFGPCLLYAHLPGPTGAAGARPLGALLRRLHDGPPPSGLRRIDTDPGTLDAAIRAELPADPRHDSALQGRIRQHLQALPRPQALPPASPVLLHGDPVPGNLVQTPGGLRLIDWQCPGLGDPCHDLALALSPAMALLYGGRRPDPAALLAAYAHPGVTARYHALAPLLHLRIAAYLAGRGAAGSAEDAEAAEAELAALTTASP